MEKKNKCKADVVPKKHFYSAESLPENTALSTKPQKKRSCEMDKSNESPIKALRSLEILYTYAMIGIWAYFEVKNEGLPLLAVVFSFVLFIPLTIYLSTSKVKYKQRLGLGLLFVIILATGFQTVFSGDEPWIIFATFYSLLPFLFVLFTWILKRWVWIVFIIFHSLIFLSAGVYAITTLWTGIVDVVFCSLIIISLTRKNTRIYFNVSRGN